jgi:ubiquinone/menaquinone biosynthesis C-methylase UbiE
MIEDKSNLITHNDETKHFKKTYIEVKNKIVSRGNLPHASVELQLDLLDQLSEFALGRFLLEHRGFDGYWTKYVIMHQFKGRITGKNDNGKDIHPIENFILNKAPSILSTQQRYLHFKDCLQKQVKSNCTIASLPCGLMGDLLTLNYEGTENVKLVGVDLDINSLKLAAQYAEELDVIPEVEFIHTDAWHLNVENEFDAITSNGLNIYEPNDNKVEELYKIFYKTLKSGGQLITSCITPPPSVNKKSEWIMEKIDKKDALLQKILFMDIIGVEWNCSRTVSQSRAMLENAGFSNITVLYDEAHIFPTFTAEKT